MNGAILLIPTILIRYGLLFLIDRRALARAAHFAPRRGAEKLMYIFYQASTLGIIVYSFFITVSAKEAWLFAGIAVYSLGALLLALSAFYFAKPSSGICQRGLYRVSRNPMYVAYFICFIGCALLTRSWILFAMVCVFQISAHWIILSEERWCIERFGGEYMRYMRRVRRYI